MPQFLKLKKFLFHNSLFVILCSLLAVAYFITRLTNLTVIPVFVDEAIYIRWAQVMRAVSSLRFLPLSDGKQPLFMWLVIPFLKVVADPLVAGRMVSVIAGFGTMVGIFVLSLILFGKKEIGLFASLLYLISPFTLFFDRMALADGLLSFFGVWTLTGAVWLVKEKRLDLAMITGILLGLGLITKSPALFFALLLPTTIILNGRVVMRPYNIIKLFFLWGIVYLFGFAIYNVLRLGPEFHMIAIRNKDYVFSLNELMRHPFNPFWGNFKNALSWLWILLTPAVFILGIAGVIWALVKNFKNGLVLLAWLAVPLLAQSAIAKVYTARYILFSVPFFLIFAAYFLEKIFLSVKNKFLIVLVLAVLFVLPLYQVMLFLINPQKAWLPANERNGYLEIWTSGYGIKEAADYLKELAEKENILVGTEGYFGTLPEGLQMYLEGTPRITVIGLGQPIKDIPNKLTNGLVNNRVFLLVNDSRLLMANYRGLRLINQYPKAVGKGGKRENLLFFEILK